MAYEIVVPDLGESVIDATVARWLKNEGDAVKTGEAVLVLETDKVDLEVGAERDGVLQSIARQAGQDVKVGEVLGSIAENGEAASAPAKAARPAKQKAPKAEAPAEETEAETNSLQEPADSAPATQEMTPGDERVTPVARRFAEENDVDIAQVTPKTPGARVTKEDVERYIAAQKKAAPANAEPVPAAQTPATPAPQQAAAKPATVRQVTPPADNGYRKEERQRMSRRRRTIAQRLVEAQHTAAMLTTFNEIDMSKVMDVRARRKESFQKTHGVGLGFSSFFVKASIGALKAFQRINAEIQEDEIVLKHYYDIGVAIGASEGLVVPVLRDADRLSFAQIEQQIKDFVRQTEDGTLSLDALRGGTFTITNGGVFGSLMSTPILNPPQVGILGLHKIEPRPIALNGEVVIRPMMYVALSYDHRIVDGREAVQFLVRVKELIEDPESLLIEG